MKYVGEAMVDILDKKKDEQKVPIIGIATWGVLALKFVLSSTYSHPLAHLCNHTL